MGPTTWSAIANESWYSLIMSFNQNRQESLPDADGTTWKVGQGVHHGFNGDRDPGTVMFVSDSGNEVWVSEDSFEITDNKGGYVEGDRTCNFTTNPLPQTECIRFKLFKRGKTRKQYFAMSARGHVLADGRAYARNPCV